MGGACNTYAGRREANTGFWSGNPKDRGDLEDPGKNARVILKWIFKTWGGGAMDWIDLTQDGDR